MAKKWLPIIAIVFALTVTFRQYLLGNVGITPNVGTNDLTDTQIPFRKALQDSLKEGQLPIWEPRISAGFPLFAEGQIAALHPINLLFALLPVSAYLSVSLNIVAAIAVSSIGMYLYLRYQYKDTVSDSTSQLIALFGSLVWGLSGFQLNHVAHLNNINVLSMLPWQLYIIDSLFRQQTIAGKMQVARWYTIPVALQIFSGHPQFTAYALLYNALYFLGMLVLSKNNFRQLATNSLVIILFLGIGVGIGAMQLISTLEFSANSTRQTGLTEESANFLSLRIKDLQTFINPFYDFKHEPRSIARLAEIGWPFDERYSYIGIIPLLLTLGALPFAIKNRSILIHAVLGLFFLLLSMGNQTPLGALLRIPPLNMFRLPAKFTVFFQSAAAILSAYSLYLLAIKQEKKNQARPFLSIVILTLLGVSLLDVAPKLYTLYPTQQGEWWYQKPQMVTAYESIIPSINSDKYYNDRIIGQNYNVQLQKQYLYQDEALWDKKQMQVFKNNRELLPAFNMLLYDTPLLTNAINSAGLKVKWYSDIESTLFFSPIGENHSYDANYWRLARLTGAKYIIHDESINDDNIDLISKTEFTTGQDQIGLYQIKDSLPFIQLPTSTTYAADSDSLAAISDPKFNPVDSAVLPDSAPRNLYSNTLKATPEVKVNTSTDLLINLQTDGSTPVIIRQTYYPGWVAYLNSQPVPIYRADHAFQAVIINTAGDHSLQLRYQPTSVQNGMYVSIVSLVLYVLTLMAVQAIYSRSSSRPSTLCPEIKPV
jgi:hypothetical protein